MHTLSEQVAGHLKLNLPRLLLMQPKSVSHSLQINDFATVKNIILLFKIGIMSF